MKTPIYSDRRALETILRWCDRGGEEPEGLCLHEIEQICRNRLGLEALKESVSICGHPSSMMDCTVETKTPFCRVCDLQSRCRDAETREKELVSEKVKLQDSVAKLTAACQYAAGSLSQVPDGAQVPPIVTMDVRDHLDKAWRGI